MIRLTAAAVLALGLMAVPVESVRACSCAMLGGTVEAAQEADLAFIGSVVDIGRAPNQANDWGPMVRYAFEVERASAETPPVVVIEAMEDPGGAACGFVFGMDEDWFVGAYRDGDRLLTGLCNGNVRTEQITAADVDRLGEILPFTPTGDGGAAASGDPASILLPTIGGLAIVVLVLLVVLAFREPRPAR